MLKAISYAKVKTDAVDARTLADLLRADLIPVAHQPPLMQRELRERTRARLRMIEHRRHLQSQLWHLAAKYNTMIDQVGWRYLDQVESYLLSRIPAAVHLETRLLIGQIRQVQHDVTLIEEDITTQSVFNPGVDLLKDLPGFLGWCVAGRSWPKSETSPGFPVLVSSPAIADWFPAAATVAVNSAIAVATKMETATCAPPIIRRLSLPLHVTLRCAHGGLKFLMQHVEFNAKLDLWQHTKDSQLMTENVLWFCLVKDINLPRLL